MNTLKKQLKKLLKLINQNNFVSANSFLKKSASLSIKKNINIIVKVIILMDQNMVNNSVIEIFVGDLSNIEYDAVVIPTNSRLLPSGDLRCKVLRKAGTQVQVECNRIINKISQIAVGDSIMTSGGNYTQYIIHANGPRLGQVKEGKNIMQATWNSLKLADEKGLNSIVFPPISKEMRGFTTNFCAKAMLIAIIKYLNEINKNLKNVSICVETQPESEVFEKNLNELTS